MDRKRSRRCLLSNWELVHELFDRLIREVQRREPHAHTLGIASNQKMFSETSEIASTNDISCPGPRASFGSCFQLKGAPKDAVAATS